MARASRTSRPGHLWHITQYCHNRQCLLKFSRDRQRWRHWLFEAKKRFGLCVLNFSATPSHVHLLVRDCGQGEITRSMQLVAGRTAQEFNRRKGRSGAFWEARYQARTIESRSQLCRCMTYIDLDVVRAGWVQHPTYWSVCGYREIQVPPVRYAVIDREALRTSLCLPVWPEVQQACRQWAEQMLSAAAGRCDPGVHGTRDGRRSA